MDHGKTVYDKVGKHMKMIGTDRIIAYAGLMGEAFLLQSVSSSTQATNVVLDDLSDSDLEAISRQLTGSNNGFVRAALSFPCQRHCARQRSSKRFLAFLDLFDRLRQV